MCIRDRSVTIDEYNDFYEDDNDIDQEEEDGMESNEASSTLPRPPTKPNVLIDDETICPVCTQKGKYNNYQKTISVTVTIIVMKPQRKIIRWHLYLIFQRQMEINIISIMVVFAVIAVELFFDEHIKILRARVLHAGKIDLEDRLNNLTCHKVVIDNVVLM